MHYNDYSNFLMDTNERKLLNCQSLMRSGFASFSFIITRRVEPDTMSLRTM